MIEKRFLKQNTIDNETRERIVEYIKGCLSNLNYVTFAYIYGSFADGGSFRDIDVAIFASKPVNELEIESDLSYDLTEKTGYPVEVRVINRAPIALQMAVLRQKTVVVSRSEEVRTDFIENTGRRYREYSHFRNIMMGA